METEPRIVERQEQPYVGIRTRVRMDTVSDVADRGFRRLFSWLADHGTAAAGPAFFRYRVIDMDGQLEIDAGVPVAERATGHDGVIADLLPGGRYASLTHVGSYDGLRATNERLLRWADERGLRWAVSNSEKGEIWASRLEIYDTDPAEEADPGNWRTEVTYLLAEDPAAS